MTGKSGQRSRIGETTMSFSLDTPSQATLKAEARELRNDAAQRGETLSHGMALERVAKAHGFRDWNTACASLPSGIARGFQVGQRVRGIYLNQDFTGTLRGVAVSDDGARYTVTVMFDQPVDVVASKLFSALRQRVVATVDIDGVSPARLGDGTPQMRLRAF
jgi:hypothetical protein